MTRFPRGFDDSAAAIEPFARDFGGVVRAPAAAVVRPSSVDEVASAIRFCRREGIRVAARGNGHSTAGQSLVAGGVQLDMSALSTVRIEGRSAIAGAGARWSSVLAASLGAALTPPTLTDYLELTVGGTLSVGGVGGSAFEHGLQTCNVESLTVVTGAGEIQTCSREERPELFDACRGGLGQCAVIVEARIRLVAAPRRAWVAKLVYDNAADLMRDQQSCAESRRFDYLLASTPVDTAGRWRCELEAVHHHQGDPRAPAELLDGLHHVEVTSTDVSFHEHASRLSALESVFAGGAHHPWMDLFVPGSAVTDLLELAHRELDPGEFRDGHLMTYPLLLGACDSPLLQLSDERYFVLFDVLPTVSAREGLVEMGERCRRIFESARSSGARVYPIGYPVGTPQMRPADWQRQFSWERFQHAKAAYDPDGVLTPGPAITLGR